MKNYLNDTMQIVNEGKEAIVDFIENGKGKTAVYAATENLQEKGNYNLETLQWAGGDNEIIICDVEDENGNYIGTEEFVLRYEI